MKDNQKEREREGEGEIEKRTSPEQKVEQLNLMNHELMVIRRPNSVPISSGYFESTGGAQFSGFMNYLP